MIDGKYRIGIGCIGSGVGQSIVDACNISTLPIYTVGFGTNDYAFGAYECDILCHTPSIYEKSYLSRIVDYYHEYKLDLFIPSLDNEVLLFTENDEIIKQHQLNAILPSFDIANMCRKKERMAEYFPSLEEYFVRTIRADDLKCEDLISPIIAKPRSGFASKGIRIINKYDELLDLSGEYIFQEIAYPKRTDSNYDSFVKNIQNGNILQVSEISIQLVTDKQGKLIGRMASYNRLNNGVPIEILPVDIPIIWDTIDQILPNLLKLGLKGPINIQGRITDQGFKIFEMNPRFTGITGLRALMGFTEVDACIRSWLGLEVEPISVNQNRFGSRQTTDKSISIECNQNILNQSKNLNNKKIKKTILITGGSGFLGTHLIASLMEKDVNIWVLNRSKEKNLETQQNERVKYFDHSDFQNGLLSLGQIDVLIHLAFAREKDPVDEIASSIDFSFRLFTKAIMSQIPAIINVSSHRVYGFKHPALWKEILKPAPENLYAQAKYTVELCLNSLVSYHKHIKTTSLRFPTLTGGKYTFNDGELIWKLTDQAVNGNPITLVSEDQKFERLDVRDAANSIIHLLDLNPGNWKSLYNVGSNKTVSLKFIAESVIDAVQRRKQGKKSDIILTKSTEKTYDFGMDCSLFMKDTSWKPVFSLEDSINSILHRIDE